jgi:negative regulator of flagellin synthesis FlgM
MSIEINGLSSAQTSCASDAAQVSSERSSSSDNPSAVAAAANDTVKLTDAAKQLSELENAVKEASSVDTQRVEALRQSIDDGAYEVNPGQVARKLLQYEAYLPNR